MKTALICGISGQDGAYLARFLLEKGYEVHGTSRDAQVSSFKNLDRLGIRDRLVLHSMALNDFRSVLQVIHRVKPDEIYNLAGQTSVGLSFEQPVETMESITLGTLNLLEAIRFVNAPIKFYNAGSSECFGNTGDRTADETTAFSPRSPYAIAKAAAHWQVANYREAYNLFACSGILFNHESPLRPRRFVTQKVVTTAIEISKGRAERLYLGDISIRRDWGWAAEYVEAMYLMLQAPQPEDYVIATGETHCLENFVTEVFSYVGLDWTAYVEVDKSLFRPSEIAVNRGSPQKAHEKLGWRAQKKMKDVARGMVDAILCDTSPDA
ncbi:GDP-mannose 4,6-dehydratase [Thermoleptolyngbya sp. C42_A2020_037]|uniref:GDP-mannose 4,6-dehydratase n=1 Tax=Thermoleptolyngbya sp. C42_A2020_037 TaxID=2747799 RepID=UPI0019EBCD94|nr:GDP-mannose 4,6-dehydratase [Thermoleptolyngbya sp. C42_A2020_037]MBF2085623.1 GDP-mannose 4,6-dehydratase [Thermoleptolyngbya sp. C42_A2020_037]